MKPTLHCTIGLPRSGKTTWAKSTGFPVVCPDAIRLALHGQRYIQLAEPFVWAIAQAMVRALFLAGHEDVVLDACNNTEKRRGMWLSSDWKTIWKIFDTTEDECIRRARNVGDEEIVPVIQRMSLESDLPVAGATIHGQ